MSREEDDLTGLGNWLAHYTTAAVAFEHILPSGELRMSPYRLMRDPAENKEGPSLATQLPDRPDASQSLFEALLLASEVHQGARLLSLTHDAMQYGDGVHDVFGCAWARPRLWEQYADQHRGVCLVFHRPRFEAACTARFQQLGVRYHLGEVAYTPSGYAGSEGKKLTDPRIFEEHLRADALIEHIERHHRDFFFLKTDDWSSEHEYRAVILGHDDEFAFVPFGESIATVIMGERFPAWQAPGVLSACASAGVQARQIGWFGGRPVVQ
jgi:Protein of unknown function (DUF2971)